MKVIILFLLVLLPSLSFAVVDHQPFDKTIKKVVHKKTHHAHHRNKHKPKGRRQVHHLAKKRTVHTKKGAHCRHGAGKRHAKPSNSIQKDVSSMTREKMQHLVHYAVSLEGVPYRFGGESPQTGFDCSGYVQHVYEHELGILLPHNAAAISKRGDRISKTELRPGDLVLFNTLGRTFGHIGIYLGEHRFIHANSSKTGIVEIADLHNRYWAKHFTAARRLSFTAPG